MAHQKRRIVLAACGCFSPITNLHLRLFGEGFVRTCPSIRFVSATELARDFLQRSRNIAVVGGIVSPTHDAYGKKVFILTFIKFSWPHNFLNPCIT